MRKDRKGFGDEQGTRIGKPDAPQRRTGAGSEASEGIHGADSDRVATDHSALEGKKTGTGGGKAGSEPIDSHDHEHESGYGGRGGTPKNR